MEVDSAFPQREEVQRSLEHDQRLRIGLEAEVASLRHIEHECLELREANRQLNAQAGWHTQQLADPQSSLSWCFASSHPPGDRG